MSKELELIADVALDYAGASPNQIAAHVVSRLSEHGYSIVQVAGAEKKAQPVRDQPDLNPNNLPLLGSTVPVAALDGIRVIGKRWLKKRLEEGIAGSSYSRALEHCADELEAAIDMAAAAAAEEDQ